MEQKYGRWTVLGDGAPALIGKHKKTFSTLLCRCDCGTLRLVMSHSLTRGLSKSCGCWTRQRSSERHTKHGATGTPEYKVWNALLQRCYNPRNKRYTDYGGRGVTVCDDWRHDFASFLAYVGPRPSPRHSIDRKDNERGYEPGNVQWSTGKEQMRNRRVTRYFEVNGVNVCLAELAEKCGIPSNTLRARLLAGWPHEKAFTQPVGPTGPSGPRKKKV